MCLIMQAQVCHFRHQEAYLQSKSLCRYLRTSSIYILTGIFLTITLYHQLASGSRVGSEELWHSDSRRGDLKIIYGRAQRNDSQEHQ